MSVKERSLNRIVTGAAIAVVQTYILLVFVLPLVLETHRTWPEVTVQVALVALTVYMLLHVFFFRPMREQLEARIAAEQELREANEQLDARVKQRTAELASANLKLETEMAEHRRTQEMRIRLTAAVEQAAEAVLVTALDGTIVYVNPAFEKMTGFTRQEAIGQNPRIVKSGRQDAAFYRELWRTITQGRVWKGHLANKRKDGTLYEEEMTISPVLDPEGRLANYVAVKHDVTKEVALQEQFRQSQKMEAVGRLAAGISHEFNNVLTVVGGYCNLLLEDKTLNNDQRRWVIEVSKAAERAAAITQRLLSFSRKQFIQLRVIDLNEIVAALAPTLRGLIGERINVVTVPDRALGRVKADRSQIEQIVVNLVLNARDAMPSGGKLALATANAELSEADAHRHPGARAGSYVVLSVSDTGIGMDTATQRRLFEPFFTTKPMGQGTGLGLSVVQGIVTQAGGHIHVVSEVGKGTSFHIYLPRSEASEEVQKPGAAAPKLPTGSETVLLAEDDDALRGLAAAFLSTHGYTVLEARNGYEALQLAERHRGALDLLVTDMSMPGINGLELVKLLKGLNMDVKFLYMSGSPGKLALANTESVPSDLFLQKPFTQSEFLCKVRWVLDAVPSSGETSK